MKSKCVEFLTKPISSYYKIKGNSGIGHPLRVYQVDPAQIKFSKKAKPTVGGHVPIFAVVGGEWDKETILWDNKPMFEMFFEHFKKSIPWEETDRYQKKKEELQKGEVLTALDIPPDSQSLERYHEYLEYIDELFSTIKNEGYRSQKELEEADDFNNRSYFHPALNEIQVFIGRDGQIISYSGLHRLCIAKVLELPSIPIRTRVRHPQWQAIRDRFYLTESLDGLNSEMNKFKDHPELTDVAPK